MVRVAALLERFRASLFWAPSLFVVAAVGLAQLLLWIDISVGNDLPKGLRSEVDAAQSLLSTIAGATITVAGIVFSVAVVAVQLASSQLSPRVLRSFLRDRVQQTVMGLLVGAFVYDLLILRRVRGSAGEKTLDPFVPHLSIIVAVLLAGASMLAILVFIDHIARRIQAGDLVDRIAEETIDTIDRTWPTPDDAPEHTDLERPDQDPDLVVSATSSGWLQQVDLERLGRLVGTDGVVCQEIRVGQFVVAGQPLASLWVDSATTLDDDAIGVVRDSFVTGRSRTMQEDVDFGLRQLVDIALRALSPGINDVTTAYEAVVHLGAILAQTADRVPPAGAVATDGGGVVLRPTELDHAELVRRAFDQIRHAGAAMPSFAEATIHHLHRLGDRFEGGVADEAAVEEVRAQVRRFEEACRAGGAHPDDVARVSAAADRSD